ncbi:hypothetical protein [Maricaulis sp.]|uniref:hypothetical protein n=1 Tax=Maricaulis sp. TaxID=1486257 RepID=UPI0032989BA7
MSSDLLDILEEVEETNDAKAARLLLLIHAFRKQDRPAIEGITKLAKLDFLLRYPAYFESAMLARGANPKAIEVQEFERHSIESSMVRYRFGPWDHSYRALLNLLAARGLAVLRVEGRKVLIDLSDRGCEIAGEMELLEEFAPVVARAQMLQRYLDVGATKIMNFIYEQFPELADMQLNERIEAETLLP